MKVKKLSKKNIKKYFSDIQSMIVYLVETEERYSNELDFDNFEKYKMLKYTYKEYMSNLNRYCEVLSFVSLVKTPSFRWEIQPDHITTNKD